MQLLRHVPNEFRGRVFSTIETWTWMTMMLSMGLAGIASDHVSPRVIGLWSGILSSSTAIFWARGQSCRPLARSLLWKASILKK